MEPLLNKYISIFKININILLLRIILIFLTAILIVSALKSFSVAVQLNELLLGNFHLINIEIVIKSIVIAGSTFTCFIFPLNYILLRNSIPEEKFIRPKRLTYFFILYILLIYATVYLSIAFFYVIVYGTFMPSEVFYAYNNNQIHMKEFMLSHIQAYISVIYIILIILLTYSLSSLFYAYRIKKDFFDFEIFDRINLFWESKKREQKIIEFKHKKLIEKLLNYKLAEIYYRFSVYYFSIMWFIEPIVIMFYVYRDTISHDFFIIKLSMDNFFPFIFILFQLVFILIPFSIFWEIKNIYGFKISNYLNEKLINSGVDFYCRYLSLLGSFSITILISGLYYILEKYAGVIPTTNIKAAFLLAILLATNYAFSKPRQILYALIKPLIYEF